MLKLHGFGRSNYYNMAKMCLLEKGLEFEEVNAPPSQEPDFLAISPMGKVPCLETEHGYLSEVFAIADYLDHIQPEPALLPAEPFARAKAIELVREIELYIELVARRALPAAFFGQDISDENRREVDRDLTRGIAALRRILVCDPYVAGKEFTLADVYAQYTFGLASGIVAKILDRDLLAEVPEIAALLPTLAERPSVQRITADQAG
jgi:glutathione S-transferase